MKLQRTEAREPVRMRRCGLCKTLDSTAALGTRGHPHPVPVTDEHETSTTGMEK